MSTPRLRILILYDCMYPESVGGVEHRNYELGRVLAERGHHVTLAGWTRGTDPGPPGVTVLALRYRTGIYSRAGKRKVTAALRLAASAATIDVGQFDVVEAANIPYLHLFPLAARCRRSGTPLVVSWYEYWGSYWREYVGGWRWPPYRLVEWLSAQIGARVCAISALTAHRLEDARRHDAPVLLFPSGIPYDRIRRAAQEANEPAPPLVYAGRLQAEKRIDLLLDAVAELSTAPDAALLAIIGEGPDRERLVRHARRIGVEDRVEFVGRLATQDDVWRRLGSAMIAVQPSSREGFGLFPLEAMAAGLPVVYCSSAESAVPEIVRDGVEGLSVSANARALAGALDDLLRDDRLRGDLAARASERARTYDWAAVGERVERFLREVASSNHVESA